MSERKEWRKNHRFGGKMLSLVLKLLRLRAGRRNPGSRYKSAVTGRHINGS